MDVLTHPILQKTRAFFSLTGAPDTWHMIPDFFTTGPRPGTLT